jgi:hypothetical protein
VLVAEPFTEELGGLLSAALREPTARPHVA